MTMLPSTIPALTAYKVYHLSQIKLDNECRRQTPDLHRIVAHAAMVDNIRRWSREIVTPSETVLVDSDSDTDSDLCEDPASDEDAEDVVTTGQVAIYDDEIDNNDPFQQTQPDSNAIQTAVVHEVQNHQKSTIPTPNRRPPPPPPATSVKALNWKQNRPILVQETVVEVDADD